MNLACSLLIDMLLTAALSVGIALTITMVLAVLQDPAAAQTQVRMVSSAIQSLGQATTPDVSDLTASLSPVTLVLPTTFQRHSAWLTHFCNAGLLTACVQLVQSCRGLLNPDL